MGIEVDPEGKQPSTSQFHKLPLPVTLKMLTTDSRRRGGISSPGVEARIFLLGHIGTLIGQRGSKYRQSSLSRRAAGG